MNSEVRNACNHKKEDYQIQTYQCRVRDLQAAIDKCKQELNRLKSLEQPAIRAGNEPQWRQQWTDACNKLREAERNAEGNNDFLRRAHRAMDAAVAERARKIARWNTEQNRLEREKKVRKEEELRRKIREDEVKKQRDRLAKELEVRKAKEAEVKKRKEIEVFWKTKEREAQKQKEQQEKKMAEACKYRREK